MDVSALQTQALLILLAPLAGAILAGALGRPVLRGRTHWVVILGVGIATVAAYMLLGVVRGAEHGHESVLIPIYQWISVGGGESFNLEVLIDPLTAIMMVTVTTVSLLVVIYSRDYMRHHDQPERGYERFFAYLGLFVFSMAMLVLGGNFLLLYLGWEAVGLCSYLLIGFYYQKPAAAAAAKKAFLVNRVGDFGFGLGILLIYLTFGSLQFDVVFDMIADGATASGAALETSRLTTIALLLLCGACGKSAQLPLHVWLPDAMEGPSPVSALIHAATMVTAGIYMIARCGAIFTASTTAMTTVAIIGAATALFAATIAVTQTDMKRILAYSTISQLGYMFLGLGVYAADSAVFHLFTHAFFKALLFLGAGSVMHAMGGIIDIRYFRGLRHSLQWTFGTFLIGALALSGFPGFSGFFSKDEIIHHALEVQPVLGIAALLTALLTAFYTFRMVFLAFWGEERVPQGVHPHESGSWMLVPLAVLSVGAFGAGYLGVGESRRFQTFLEPVVAVFHHPTGFVTGHAEHAGIHLSTTAMMILSGVIAVAGIAAAYFLYVRKPQLAERIRDRFVRVYELLWNKYFVDELYTAAIVRPLHTLGRVCVAIDDFFLDGLVWFVTAVPRALAFALRPLHGGAMQGYGLTMVAGAAVIVLIILVL